MFGTAKNILLCMATPMQMGTEIHTDYTVHTYIIHNPNTYTYYTLECKQCSHMLLLFSMYITHRYLMTRLSLQVVYL
jgi:hypothetical protein